MADYDLSAAFQAIEDELISSMIRNLDRHRAEETELGYRWEQWQTVQLKALEDYRKNNLKKFPPIYNKLNQQIREVLQDSYNDGSTKQERKILQAVKRGFKGEAGTNSPAFTGQTEIEGNFFRTNDRKLDALIEATTHDMQKAEVAVLRQANDQYRKVIFNAQLYANTGAGTYEKAVDMATRDFLRAGINSIQYKNGSRHTISEYAEMAIRTASKRAYLQGEGEKRKEWGVTTVILNKRACPCPKCAPFVGKVFIDDVWSGGDSSGISPVTGLKYPLLSEAIAAGLYHPNCRDSHTTYFEGISTAPADSSYTKEELQAMVDTYKAEQEKGYCERQEERYDRMSQYSLDPDNRRSYQARANEWHVKSKRCNAKLKLYKKRLSELSKDMKESGVSEQKTKMSATNNSDNDWSNAVPQEHTKEERAELLSYASVRNVKIQGVRDFDGDIDMLKEQIDNISSMRDEYKIKPKITVRFSDMSDDDFAFTYDSTIHFNKKALRNRAVTEENLKGNYLASTNAVGISAHEMGHIIAQIYGEKGIEIAKKAYYNIFKAKPSTKDIVAYLRQNLSKYSVDIEEFDPNTGLPTKIRDKDYIEVIPEVIAKSKLINQDDSFINEFIKLLKEMIT